MFSNLRYYGGGNHYLVPIGVLGDNILHGRGVATVHYSTSDRLNLHVGHILSKTMWSEAALAAMRDGAGMDTPVVQYMSLVMANEPSRSSAIMGDLYKLSNPTGSTNAIPFLLPLSTVRRAIRSARVANETFTAHISLPDNMDRRVRVVTNEDPECYYDHRKKDNCTSDDPLSPWYEEGQGRIALQWMVDKFLSPYPQLLDGLEQEACMT